MNDEIPKTIPVKNREDPFVIEEVIGEGGMGKVYRAHDPSTGDLLAVKVLGEVGDPTRFAVESDILSKLSHPNIVAYKAHGLTKDGHPYLAMEWIDGDDLEKQLETANLTVEETVRVARRVADALAAAHEAGVVHRDLKPSNVILTRKERAVKLVDFGIARSASVDGLTKTGQALGTPGYMSPEQARGQHVDSRTDLFSLGCLIFRCVGGRRPFAGSDIMQFATSLALENPPSLRELAPLVPPDLEALVEQLLQKDPKLRPESALHVKQALDRIATGSDRTALAPTANASVIGALDKTELAPAVPIATRKSEDEPPARPRWLNHLYAIAVTLVVCATGTKLWGWITEPAAPPRMPAPVASVPSAAPAVSADRGALDRACKRWAQAIAKGQHSDGSFAGEERAQSSGWDTAQQLFALADAHRACDGATKATLGAGARALEGLRIEGGWMGPRSGAVEPKDQFAETAVAAWATLALDAMGEGAAADRARKDLLVSRNADGGFRPRPRDPSDGSALYPTMLAAYALGSSEEGDAAREWIAKAVAKNAYGTREIGSTEELAYVFFRGTSRDQAAKTFFITETVAHCRADEASGKCMREIYETGRSPLLADGGTPLITPWHPWATLAAAKMAKNTSNPVHKTALEGIARWGTSELTSSIDTLGAAPAYKLAEYLIVVSELIELR